MGLILRMPNGRGLRSKTRDLYSRTYRRRGYIPSSVYLYHYAVGDYVDIKVNGAVQKCMPSKAYQGRTGLVWNVTKRAIGVEIKKLVRTRKLRKRLYIRIEHVQPSLCREDFLIRVKKNQMLGKHIKHQTMSTNVDQTDTMSRGRVCIRRQPKGPMSAYSLLDLPIKSVSTIPSMF